MINYMYDLPFDVIDSEKKVYHVTRFINEDAQGSVYLLEDEAHIVKLFPNTKQHNSIKATISYLNNLDLSLKRFAVPRIEVISPQCGYIANFCSELMPISKLICIAGNETKSDWYAKTGGTNKRYAVLSNLAFILRGLHFRGLTFCNISSNNVYISSSPNNNKVFLINVEHLRHKTCSVSNTFTPRYGAPEVVSFEAANTPMSDCFSFAVLAYEVLTQSHPFLRNETGDGIISEEDNSNGEITEDNKNPYSSHGHSINRKRLVFISPELMNLFIRMFYEANNNPDKRPDMYEWYEVMSKSFNNLLKCPYCHIDYFYDNEQTCPFCEQEVGNVVHLSMKCWDETGEIKADGHPCYGVYERVWEDIIIDDNTSKTLTTEHFLCSKSEIPEKVLEVAISGMKEGKPVITLNPVNGKEFHIYSQTGVPFDSKPCFSTPIRIPVNQSSAPENKKMITMNPLEENFQRVLTIE